MRASKGPMSSTAVSAAATARVAETAAASSPATTATTTAGNEALSAAASRTDSALFEPKRCYTGGQQQQPQQYRHNNSNGAANANNWRQMKSMKYNSKTWLNERRPNHFNNNNNNNWNNFCPNPNNYPDNSRDFNFNQNNNWQRNNNWNNSRETFRQEVHQSYNKNQHQSRRPDYQERTDYYRNSSESRSGYSSERNANRNDFQGKRNSNVNNKRINDKRKDKQIETQNKTNESKQNSEENTKTKEKETNLKTAEKDIKKNSTSSTSISKEINKEANFKKNNSEQEKGEPRNIAKDYLEKQDINNSKNKTPNLKTLDEKSKSPTLENTNKESKGKTKEPSKRVDKKEDKFKTRKPGKAHTAKETGDFGLLVKNQLNQTQSIENNEKKQAEPIEKPQAQLETCNTEKNLEVDKETNVKNSPPTIQVRPLTELLRQEILAVTQEQLHVDSSPSKSTAQKPAQIRRRTISSGYINNTGNGDLSINDRLAHMDKESLKYIINNSDTIFNEHLKSQARRRLREEIRRQLKEIELDQPKDQPTDNLVEDVIVDAIKLPQLLLQEIEKCFGIDIVVPEVQQEELDQSTKEFKCVALKTEECNEECVINISEEDQNIEASQENSTQTPSSEDCESDARNGESTKEASNREQNTAESEFIDTNYIEIQSSEESELYTIKSTTCKQEFTTDISKLNQSLSDDDISFSVDGQPSKENSLDISGLEEIIQIFEDAESKQSNNKLATESSDEEQNNKESNQAKIENIEIPSSPLESEKEIDESKVCELERELHNSNEPNEGMSKESSTDLMSRLKVAEQFKALTAKRSNNDNLSENIFTSSPNSKQSEPKSPLKKRRKKAKRLTVRKADRHKKQLLRSPEKPLLSKETDSNIMPTSTIKIEIKTESKSAPEISLIVLSSSEDEVEELTITPDLPVNTESVVDLDNNAVSNQSSSSNETSQRRYQQKLKIDADNVVNSFEKLILPQLKESLAERYRSSHCTNLQARLHFISCVVTSSEYNSQTFSKIQVAKMQQNLKTADNRLGIDFLLREIVNVINLQKERKQEQGAFNELITTSPLKKTAELASVVTHQSICSNDIEHDAAETAARTLMPPTPPRNGTPTPASVETALRSLSTLPLGIPHVTLPRLSPNNFGLSSGLELNDSTALTSDMVLQHLLEVDRRLLENQSRRGFLDEMILKFQKEKSDLETLNLELQSRKLLLLSSAISKHQTTVATPAPAVATSESATLKAAAVGKSKQRKRPVVIVKRVKLLPNRRPPAKRLRAVKPKKDETTKSEEENAALDTQTNELPGTSTDPLDIQLHIKDEPELENQPKAVNKRVKSQPTTVDSPKRQRLSRTSTSSTSQQPLAVIPPLPPPPPPPEPFAHLSYDGSISTPSAGEEPTSVNMANFNYGYIPSGRLHNITSPITQIRIYKLYIIAASENGDVYMFNIGNHKLELQITKHSEAITNMFLCEKDAFLYTTSLDGFLKKSSLENLERVMQTVYLKEPLQSIDVAWGIAFIGSRWGNVFTYNIASNKVMDMPLLSTGQSIIAIKATKEGVRKIILLGCKGNSVFLHDAATGLILRRLAVPDGLNVYSLLLTDGHVYCGTQKNEIFKVDFASGALTRTMSCGNGAVAMAVLAEKYLLIGCYDGFIYVLNKENGKQLGRFSGPGRLVLSLAIAGDKVVASSKDNSLEILEIPAELLNFNKVQ